MFWLYQPIAIPMPIVVDDEAVRQAIDIGYYLLCVLLQVLLKIVT